MSLFIACPCYQGQIHVKCMECITALILICHNQSMKYRFFTLTTESLVSRARNVCASVFLKSEFDYMIFIDSDIIFDPYDVLKLLAYDKKIIAGIYPTKKIDFELMKQHIHSCHTLHDLMCKTCTYPLNDLLQSEAALLVVKEAPTGFMVIKREVFANLMDSHKHLKYKNDIPGYNAHSLDGYFYNFFPVEVHDGRLLSEDYGFCHLTSEKIYVDPSVTLVHIGTMHYYGNLKTKIQNTIL